MKGKKTRKCQLCGIDDTPIEKMKSETVGGKRPIEKYFHDKCHLLYLEKKERIERELLELDELRLVIQKIFAVDPLPQQAYPLLQKIRNGEPITGKNNSGKRYKEGYSYSLIREAFEHCEDTITYWNGAKDFNGFMNAFRYALAIVIDKLYVVEQKVAQREQQKILMEKHIERLEDVEHEYETSYKKPSKSKTDISDFLDD